MRDNGELHCDYRKVSKDKVDADNSMWSIPFTAKKKINRAIKKSMVIKFLYEKIFFLY